VSCVEMLDEVAAYLTLAPLAASLLLGALAAALWFRRLRPAAVRVRVHVRHRRP
jgi:hypothetical protein